MFRLYVAVISALLVLASTSTSAGLFDKFRDSETGEFDASDWLLEHRGILPVPIIISDPAVGYGLGLAGAFFHKGDGEVDEDGVPLTPPSVSAVAAAYTDNDSWFVGGGHMGVWKQDHIRYTGILGYADLNLKFFAKNQSDDFSGLGFGIKGTFIDQEILFRLSDTKWFLGGSYRFLNADVDFLTGIDIPGLDGFELGSARSSGISGIIKYDNRNNLFSPTQGQLFEFEALFNRKALGSDDDFDSYHAKGLFWWPIHSLIAGLRLDAKGADGDTPFYEIPFIEMRGIPSMRYQGEAVTVAETELTWQINHRYAVLGFVGAGWAADSFGDLDQSDTIISKGVGVRYQMARKLGLWSGFDVAFGPEDTVFYIQAGGAW